MALEIILPKDASLVKVLMDGKDITKKLDLTAISASVSVNNRTTVTMTGFATVKVFPELGLEQVSYNNAVQHTRPIFGSRLGAPIRGGLKNGS